MTEDEKRHLRAVCEEAKGYALVSVGPEKILFLLDAMKKAERELAKMKKGGAS